MSKHNAPKNKETIAIAWQIMNKYHDGQWRRRCPLPYAAHPALVTHRLTGWGITDQPYVVECSLTHDVIEDAFEEFAAGSEIYHRLGPRYYDIVMELTFKFSPDKGTSKNQQKSEYLASFATKSVEALVIKVADRLVNVSDFLSDDPGYVVRYWDKAAPLFEAMVRRREEIELAFGQKVVSRMDDDYHETLEVIKRFR